MNTVENIGDHLAYTCQCGGVNFCLLRSGNVECNKCQDRPGMTWTYEEKDESSQCKECFGKGWNEVFHKVAGHYEGGEVFQDECEACGGSGAAAPAPVVLTEEVQALIGSMVSELRQHRYCGDNYPESGWPGVVKVLADYAAFKRSAPAPVAQPARWYMVNKIGMATLCTDEYDARIEAANANEQYPLYRPHRAVQLVEVAGQEGGK